MSLYETEQNGMYLRSVSVSAWPSESGEKIVTLIHYAGAMSMHFHMAPHQAREMAAKLIAAADAFEHVEALEAAA